MDQTEYSRHPLELLSGGACCLLFNRPQATTTPLTAAEQVVLALLLNGMSNKEIAATLGKAEPTVKNQVAAILTKHRIPSRTRLIALLR